MPTTQHRIVGPVDWKPLPEGQIQILGDWEAKNIVTVDVPELKGAETYGGKMSGKVRFYKGAAAQLQAAFRELGERGLLDRVLFWDGSFVPRMIRGSTKTPSEHTFGCAIDMNARWNGLGVTPPAAGLRGSVRELVPTLEKHGFEWGGGWSRRDGMHFQIAKLGVYKEEKAPDSLSVFVDGLQQVIPALFLDGKSWIGVRELAKKLNGKLLSAGGDPFQCVVNLKGKEYCFDARNEGGIGYVAFSDVMPIYNLPYTFDKKELRIDIRTKA